MSHPPDSHDPAPGSGPGRRSTRIWVFVGFVAAAAFFLFTEHRAHLLGALPYLILLACPLMHVFMHHGHGHRHGGPPPRDTQPPRPGDPA